MARRGSRVVVATAGREAIGLAWVLPAADDERCAYVEEVGVIHQRQRQGVGSQLLRETASWMLELGFETMLLYPISDSHWISRLGFEPDVGGGFLGELAGRALRG
jgi:GNAT superfamily N-acetyltransferase